MNKRSFKAKVKRARELTKEIEQLKYDIFRDVNLENVPFEGINSDNLYDAINCFIDYGEGVISIPVDNEDEIIEALWYGYREHI
jgi:hypothetical protein